MHFNNSIFLIMKVLELIFIFFVLDLKLCDSICYFPSTWYQATPIWQDSHKGQVFIFDTFIQGWRHQLYDVNITRWNCYILQTDLVVIRSQSPVLYNGTDYTAYGCMAFNTMNSSLIIYSTLSGSSDDIFVSTNNSEEMCSVCTKDIDVGNLRALSSSGNPSEFLSSSWSDSVLQTFEINKYCPHLTSSSNSTNSTVENTDNMAQHVESQRKHVFILFIIFHILVLWTT